MDNPSQLQLPQLALSSEQHAIIDAHVAAQIGLLLSLSFTGDPVADQKACYAYTHHQARFLTLTELKKYDEEVLKQAQEENENV